MFAAVCGLLGRSLFVTVAAPLVLLGSLLVQVSIELEVQSVQNLKYAVEESSIAIGSEEEAARDVGEAALDQTEAELLDNEAKSLDANVAESTAASAAEAAEGEAAVEAAEGEKVSELSEQVESLASVVAEKLPKLPVAAEAGGLDVAGEAEQVHIPEQRRIIIFKSAVGRGYAAVDAVAATASGVAAPAVGADAVLAGVAGTVAEEGPKVVAAAKEEWAVGSTELQAANDERLGVEKEVQAGALEADVPILQASAASAEEAAYGSMLTAVGYLTGATASQLLALVVQVPVLAVFGSQWMLELRANVKSKVEGIRSQDSTQLTVEFLSYLALYGAVGASMLTPWANLVVMAARFEEMGDEVAHQLSAIPALVSKALPILTHRDTSTTEFRHQNASLRELKLRRAHPRRLWDWKKPMGWMTKTLLFAEAMGAFASNGPKKQSSSDSGRAGGVATPAKLRATEVVDLSSLSGDFETTEATKVAYHLLLSARSRRGIGFACSWNSDGGGAVQCLAIAVEDSVCVFQTEASGSWLPAIVRDLLTHAQLPKMYAGDLALLQEKLQKSFNLSLSGVIDIRTQGSSLNKKAVVTELEEISCQSTNAVAQRAFLSLLAMQDPKPPKVAQVSSELKLKADWQQQRILLGPDGFYCWECSAGPSGEANMQQHVDSAQHKRRMVLAGLKQDDAILPPVPKEYEDRGIIMSRKDGTLQYTCKLCKAGPFSTLESVKSHLGGSKHSLKEGREPELSLSMELAKEGFILVDGQWHCERCKVGPFDRSSFRQHRLSLQHREAEMNEEMELQLQQLPGYCHIIGSTFCCYMCDVSAITLDGMLQHISGKAHRKACVAFEESEPMILCKELVAKEAWRSYPLEGRLRDTSTWEPIWRKNLELWSEGPGVRKPSKSTGPVGPTLPRVMVVKEDVQEEGLLEAKLGDKVTVLEEHQGEDKVWVRSGDGGLEGWMYKSQLIKKLPPWQLKKVKKEPEKTLGSTMMVQSDVTTLEGPQSLCANEGDQVELLVYLTDSTWACVRDQHGKVGLLPSSSLVDSWDCIWGVF
eukprot:symbB.v1.2.029401.t1/scaffold3200.1/size61408/3